MLEENSNHKEETSEDSELDGKVKQENQELKPPKGDGSDNDEGNQDDFLARINKETGKNFKTVDDWKKSNAELETALTKKGREEKETPPTKPQSQNKLVENVFFSQNPAAKENWEFVKKEAETVGKDPFDYYLSSELIQEKVNDLYKEQQKKNDSRNRMEAPTNKVEVTKTEEKNPFDKDYPNGFAITKKK